MLRASVVVFASVGAGLLLGSGLAAILGERLFPVEPGPPPPSAVAAPHADVNPDAILAGGLFAMATEEPRAGDPDAPTRCDPSMRLVGVVVVHTEPKRAFAALVASTERLVVGPGASFGAHTVVSVEPERATLRRADGVTCELSMFGPHEAPSPPPAAARDPAAGIHQLGPRHVRIDRSALDAARTRRSTVTPLMLTDGSVRLFGVRAGSAPHAAGLRNRDTVRSVDGQPPTADAALAAFARAQRGEPVRLQIERRGQLMEMTYELSAPD